MTKATDDYFADENAVAAWMAECCVLAADYEETLQILFTSWQSWAEANGEYVGSRRRLAQRLNGHDGLSRNQDPDSRLQVWRGVRVCRTAAGKP